jgi:cytochrome P450
VSDHDAAAFVADPLGWLLDASRRGPTAIVSRSGSVLSRAPSGSGTVAVFGPDSVRTVLNDIATFGMPVSVSTRYRLPEPLANLNNALFSMTGAEHRERQHLLAKLLAPALGAEHRDAIERGVRAFLGTIPPGAEIRVIQEMRELARHVAEEVLFGSAEPHEPVGREIQRYFELRRRYASREGGQTDEGGLDALVAQGTRVDSLLRARVRALRRSPRGHGYSVLGELCSYADDPALALGEDELVAHANILFMSSSEPIATAMTWTLLALASRPALRAAIREEGEEPFATSPLLVGTIREVLRLVPPSAILVRLTRRAGQVGGVDLPAGCEVILSPFVEHRRPFPFVEPHRLWPERWRTVQPGPYEFLPFGAGARACLGRRIALSTLKLATRAILAKADPVLAHPQWLDWRMNLTLLPSTDPVLHMAAPGSRSGPVAELSGPAAALLTPEGAG